MFNESKGKVQWWINYMSKGNYFVTKEHEEN